jgi:hypothetical protein
MFRVRMQAGGEQRIVIANAVFAESEPKGERTFVDAHDESDGSGRIGTLRLKGVKSVERYDTQHSHWRTS